MTNRVEPSTSWSDGHSLEERGSKEGKVQVVNACLKTLDESVARCRGCHVDFDPYAAAWCTCIGSSRTLECPRCGTCYCRTPVEWDRLWNSLPHDRRPRRSRILADPRSTSGSWTRSAADFRVLVVDDDESVRRLACTLIRNLGYHVKSSSSGLDGLAVVADGSYALVLADALMPGMDGREMCRRIKTDPLIHWMHVIIMSGVYVNPRYGLEARDAFLADDFLCKPISIASLRSALERQFYGQRAHVGGAH